MATGAGPGWYPDPRGGDGLRYWTGDSWAPDESAAAQQSQQSAQGQQPPHSPWAPGAQATWGSPGTTTGDYEARQPETLGYPLMYPPTSAPRTSAWKQAATWVALSLGVIAGFGAGFAVADARDGDRRTISDAAPSARATAAPEPGEPSTSGPPEETEEPSVSRPRPTPRSSPRPTPSPRRIDPDAGVLSRIGLQPRDVDSTVRVGLIPGGAEVDGTTTLDLCKAEFPSEARRTARRQLAAVTAQGEVVMSTEAVHYEAPAALETAFRELTLAADKCSATTGIDRDWSQVDGIERLAFETTQEGQDGAQVRSTAVYMRRGRTLLALYFPEGGLALQPVAGKDKVPDVVAIFAQRLATMPTGEAAT